ncbi:unnamed protein product [Boreogadus saida]
MRGPLGAAAADTAGGSSAAPPLGSDFPLQGLQLLTHQWRSEAPAERNTEVKSTPTVAMRSSVPLYLSLLLCAFLGVACVAGVCVWNSQWHGGFAWDDSGLKFNWHPVLMVSGLVVVYGFVAGKCFKLSRGMRTFRDDPVFSCLNDCVTPASVFVWAVGVGAFLLPCSPVALRVLLKPLHVWLGASVLTLSIAACVSGINEKLIFALKGTANGTLPYSALPPEAVFANSLGALIVVFGLVVLRILSNRSWERPVAPGGGGGQDAAYRPLLQEENE